MLHDPLHSCRIVLTLAQNCEHVLLSICYVSEESSLRLTGVVFPVIRLHFIYSFVHSFILVVFGIMNVWQSFHY